MLDNFESVNYGAAVLGSKSIRVRVFGTNAGVLMNELVNKLKIR